MVKASKVNCILDLDNTIISSLTFAEVKKFKPSDELIHNDMEDYYRVYDRPYLQYFLDFLFENFTVSVFTAASRPYCNFIVKNTILTKPGRKLKLILYDKHCDESRKLYNKNTPKDLRYVFNFAGFHKCNTILIDDLSHVKKAQPDLIISARYFDASKKNAKKDSFLKDLIPVLQQLVLLYQRNHCAH